MAENYIYIKNSTKICFEEVLHVSTWFVFSGLPLFLFGLMTDFCITEQCCFRLIDYIALSGIQIIIAYPNFIS
jgi:hypothetical protein